MYTYQALNQEIRVSIKWANKAWNVHAYVYTHVRNINIISV